ncbi:peptidyl-prolyl cis-trans isomerase [Acetobacter malorum DSM 14337]|uniref:Parvulin-like PPIase n=1 Tax=Acetobacter malorum DSM 14337 TaxID=1307910 RepID=A0ABQ0PTI2_9PROT|nr:peptidylprolyl isomerase [Acetobacter malorum]KXV04822.1 peptidylprolyl isomerase [Acetobacter malorum]GBQ80907.1 peptidyl-prolyl cis-trans isomerase [Acetobacter malorum DSM 14337]
MISYLRRVFVESWLGRVCAIVIFLAFIGWGVGDVLGYMGTETDVVAKVGQQRISSADLGQSLQGEMPTIAKQMGVSDPSQVPPAMRQQIAYQVLQRLIGQAELLEAARKLKVSVPDSAVRNEVFSLPYFKGANGQFDRNILNARLRERDIPEQRFLTMIRDDLASRTMLQPIGQAATVSDTIAKRLSDFGLQTRTVDLIRIPFVEQPTPAAPDDATLHRYYANHLNDFRTAELRHARVVVLSPATVADTITIDEKDLKRVYDEESDRYHVPETRDVQVVTMPDEAQARAVADVWTKGADWAAVQAAAKGGASVEMPGARPSTIPSESLSKAVFAAPLNQIQGPFKSEGGWVVLQVTKVTPPKDTPFEVAKKEILQQYRDAKGPSVVGERSRQLQDAMAGNGLDAIPTDIGAAAAAGTLDTHGNTQDGTPAPLPASGKLRDAIVQQVFAQTKGGKPNLTEGPDNSWYAVEVDSITPAAQLTFEQAKANVLAAWQAEARKHTADEQATALYTAAQTKGGLANVAGAGAPVVKGLTFSRAAPNKAIPSELMDYLPRMKAGQSVMGEDAGEFIVATVTNVSTPNPTADLGAYQRLKSALAQSTGDDLVASYVEALSKRTPPVINQRAVTATLSSLGFDGSTTP